VRIWTLRPHKVKGGIFKRIYTDLPFTGPCDDPITVTFQPPQDAQRRFEKLQQAVEHEATHVINRMERFPVTWPWIWYDEALANHHAVGHLPISFAQPVPPLVPIDDLGNRFAGLYFVEFLTVRFGTQSSRKVWRSTSSNVFEATEKLMEGATLVVEFFIWLLGKGLLKETARIQDEINIPSLSYSLVPLSRMTASISIVARHAHIVFCNPSAVSMISVSGAKHIELIPQAGPSGQLLLVNSAIPASDQGRYRLNMRARIVRSG
jgi:hypothetical protein